MAAPAAHPRSRGEHGGGIFEKVGNLGSSPLARGTRAYGGFPDSLLRLIPARAGNTLPLTSNMMLCPAHPRSRGEHPSQTDCGIWKTGSSPLARGTLNKRLSPGLSPRLTPARAGNTIIQLSRASADTAHPRSRGEHDTQPLQCGLRGGSPPLARGTQRSIFLGALKYRLTPARAGNTLACRVRLGLAAAHPRSRGEHIDDLCLNRLYGGSPPLARGTHAA